MSNTVITNYTDLNGPSTKADSSVVVIVNKDGSLSVDENMLGTLMGSDGSQAAGISVVRVGHEGRPDDATDSETDEDNLPHVTLSVDSYYGEPNSIIKYDSGAEMLQSLIIETRENSLLGFQNDHCYTPLTSPDQTSHRSEGYGYEKPIIEFKHQPPPKPVPNSKKITILDEKIIPKGRKIVVNPLEGSLILKGKDVLHKPLPLHKAKVLEKALGDVKSDESSSITSGDSIPDHDSDSDYKEVKEKGSIKKSKLKPRILKHAKDSKLDARAASRLKSHRNIIKKEIKEKILHKSIDFEKELDNLQNSSPQNDPSKVTPKQMVKSTKKDKKTPAHVSALLSDMSSLFSTPDVIRRISTDGKTPTSKDPISGSKLPDESGKSVDKTRQRANQRTNRQKLQDKNSKGEDLIPQIDDASLAQILQDTPSMKNQVTAPNSMNSPGLAGPLSPTLDLLGGLQPEEEGLTEDLLMHVAQLVESSENLQEVIDKQVLGKVDVAPKTGTVPTFQPGDSLYTPSKSAKALVPRKDPIEIVRKDGRVITLPPIEAPATRSSKRKSQMETPSTADVIPTASPAPIPPMEAHPEPQVTTIIKQYTNKKSLVKKVEEEDIIPVDKVAAESQESWNSEDDPNRLWCICRQPHNNRFMICCDGCEDWFHGKCVNITKAMGQQMEEQGIEWRCPNCVKKTKTPKLVQKTLPLQLQKKRESLDASAGAKQSPELKSPTKTGCIVCKKPARASSIYCSDACILKHAQDSLSSQASTKLAGETGKSQDKVKAESRVIVFERKTGRCLAGPSAPTAENLRAWLQKNPTFEVVRPGTLSSIRPGLTPKKVNEPKKIQTTLNFEKLQSKKGGQSILKSPVGEASPKVSTPIRSPRPAPRSLQVIDPEPVRVPPLTPTSESKKTARPVLGRSPSGPSKATPSPSTSRRKDAPDSRKRTDSADPIRDNVRKALQEQMGIRMSENDKLKFTEEEIKQFAIETEAELHDLFRDVGVKYKAKYRSLMFNIKDRKNLSLWQKICDKTITPKQLVRLSPEELASQELAQWRDQEAKHQLELIKKSELDLLAASKTYVLKTHKGEEVMENKTSVATELDPNVPVEDLVTALNDSTVGDVPENESSSPTKKLSDDSGDKHRSKRRKLDKSEERRSRGSNRDKEHSRRSSRNRSESKKDSRAEKSSRQSEREKSRDRSKRAKDKSKEESSERRSSRSTRSSRSSASQSRSQERSRSRSRRRSRSKEDSRSKDYSRRRSSRSKRKSRSRDRSDDKPKRSKSQDTSKSKNDSVEADTVERPKSALMKEAHPEYDPHEPMITSAISEEDLRKSGDDLYDENYKSEVDFSEQYDPVKSFTIDTKAPTALSRPKRSTRKDKSEAETKPEPSSTSEIATAVVWNGCINMVDVARFYVAAHEVSGQGADLEQDLSPELEIVGRINPETVWDYITKMKRACNKDIVVLKLEAANDEEKMQYFALYSYLSSRNRLGVVKVSNTTTVKDFYIVPLGASASLPEVLGPLPALQGPRSHLLVAILVRLRRKRVKDPAPPAQGERVMHKRSYSPPVIPALSSSVKDLLPPIITGSGITALSTSDDEPYDPAEPRPDALRNKMAELKRQIEEQEQQILKLKNADNSADEEAYSPSRPLTPPPPAVPLADIALPSNLQEILASIKQRSEAN